MNTQTHYALLHFMPRFSEKALYTTHCFEQFVYMSSFYKEWQRTEKQTKVNCSNSNHADYRILFFIVIRSYGIYCIQQKVLQIIRASYHAQLVAYT